MNEKEIIRDFLEKITDDILTIDGGCNMCIKDFCDNINETLQEYNLRIETNIESRFAEIEILDI